MGGIVLRISCIDRGVGPSSGTYTNVKEIKLLL